MKKNYATQPAIGRKTTGKHLRHDSLNSTFNISKKRGSFEKKKSDKK